jgi:hypothetical protein
VLTLSHDEITAAGGVLPALTIKGTEFLSSLIDPNQRRLVGRVRETARFITHASPHLDEYLAMLLFRACLPREMWLTPLREAVLFSHDQDILAQQIWPTAVLFGFGAQWDGGAKTTVGMFDEHVLQGAQQRFSSCANMVLRQVLGGLSALQPALQWVYGEVDHIDAEGEAHPLHLGNLIKTLHDTEFIFERGKTPADDIRDFLSEEWKRTVVDSTVVAITYCLHNRINLLDVNSLQRAIGDSLDHYVQKTLWRTDDAFQGALQFVRGNVLNLRVVTQDAVLKSKTVHGDLSVRKDKQGRPIPQRLILPRIALACTACWGPEIGQIIMAHLWDATLVGQIGFAKVAKELSRLNPESSPRELISTSVGQMTFRRLDECRESARAHSDGKAASDVSAPVWIVSLLPSAQLPGPHRAIVNYINKRNQGVGLVLIENARDGTRFVNKCEGFPLQRWDRIIQQAIRREGDSNHRNCPGAWHVTRNRDGVAAPFLLNGNKAHQYVPRSSLDADALAELVRRDYVAHPN